jgi:hypothetical protein
LASYGAPVEVQTTYLFLSWQNALRAIGSAKISEKGSRQVYDITHELSHTVLEHQLRRSSTRLSLIWEYNLSIRNRKDEANVLF